MVWSIGSVAGGCLVDATPVLNKDETYVLLECVLFSIECYLFVMVQIFVFMMSVLVDLLIHLYAFCFLVDDNRSDIRVKL